MLMDVLSGPDPLDWTSLPAQDVAWTDLGVGDDGQPWSPRGLRVGVWTRAGYGVEPEPEVVAEGTHPVERLASLVALTDFASVYLALAHGLDPSTSGHVADLKERMQ